MNRWLLYLAAMITGLLVTYALFYFMHYLTSHGKGALVEGSQTAAIEFIRVKESESIRQDPPVKLEIPKPQDTPPPPPAPENMETGNFDSNVTAFKIPRFIPQPGIHGIGFNGAPSDGEATPMVRVQPQYPYRAASQGIEGWVEVEFSITGAGTVQNVRVIESEPAIVFNRAAVRAVSRWKFKPKIVNGKPVTRYQVRQRIRFSLEQKP